ncbi:rhodanese-like domain-containing protein [Streptomyces sp. ICN441]|uniref:Rhodanese-like domain-containing protein n=1 Tax=Streptomyces tirandamycinicus TaxID=2174846 RepID=A0A2S1SM36_9ACTN|nr:MULTISPECIES: rhodanese-like domain-containing protein [Streptomyces]AWI27441.1 rhodanese-like domain-containing protein [Streptomyces tirandamycinicus]MCY0982743.1 rhodanese-like domain-containing protein [Streptomyces tirandamycinicus]NNJ05294.1 rhodanese-like domain-containing protein [Streptomyces sp. PKU-MA01144]TFE47877.1 rhodanese-like domain-containing protein [Streptomyces sp. ICN441]
MFLFRRHQPRVTVGRALRRTSGGRPDAVLLDVREQPEWEAGHAPDAVHLPLSRLLAGSALPPVAAGRTLLVICRSGRRSLEAAKLLTERGARAVNVEGGMIAWAAAGHPVVDERGNSGRIA